MIDQIGDRTEARGEGAHHKREDEAQGQQDDRRPNLAVAWIEEGKPQQGQQHQLADRSEQDEDGPRRADVVESVDPLEADALDHQAESAEDVNTYRNGNQEVGHADPEDRASHQCRAFPPLRNEQRAEQQQ